MTYLFVFFSLAVSSSETLSQSPQWQRLLHFQNSQSKISSPTFFMTGDVHATAEQELQSLITQLQDPSLKKDNDHPLCRFPARSLFVYQNIFKQENIDTSFCEKLQKFIERTSIESVAVVFSSYYLHNPSSAFGHTLLKIHRKNATNDLLDYGINFAATADTPNSLLYALKGLFGFFKGEFTAVPYYYKIREYNDYESRDLWTYQLLLTDEEKKWLVFHIWELGNAWAPYYYLDENCSYWVLRVLEAVSPRLQLLQYLPQTHVLPIDTLRALYKNPNLVGDVTLRPSLRKKVERRFSFLSSEEKKSVSEAILMENNSLLKTKNSLDAALDLFDYHHAQMAVTNEPLFEQKKRPLLIARSKIAEPPTPLQFLNEAPPDQVHGSSLLALGVGSLANHKSTLRGRWKPALHDLIDSHKGFDPSSEINFLDTEFSMYQKEDERWNLKLRKLDIVRVSVLNPIDPIDARLAWRFQTGLHPLSRTTANRHGSLFLSMAPGYSFQLPFLTSDHFLYALVHSEADQSYDLPHNISLQLGPEVGASFSILENWKTLLDIKYVFMTSLNSHWRETILWNIQTQYSFEKNKYAILLEWDGWDHFSESQISIKYYF